MPPSALNTPGPWADDIPSSLNPKPQFHHTDIIGTYLKHRSQVWGCWTSTPEAFPDGSHALGL